MPTAPRPRPLVAGNWKMNGVRASLGEFDAIAKGYGPALRAKVELLVCPPATLVFPLAQEALGTRIGVGGQDCHTKEAGAHTVTFPPRCWPTRGPPPSSSDTPSVAPIIARVTPW